MDELVKAMKIAFSTEFSFYLKAHYFHWNVEGSDFLEYHELFGKIYEEVYDNTIDKCAEYVRTLGGYAPGSITRFAELSVIPDQTKIPRAELMFEELLDNNAKIIELLNACFEATQQENKQGIANFIADRLDAHEKHAWMIRSILTKGRA